MNTRKFILSLLLLVTATFVSGVFAQSAEEAAKYGQLQEIQLPKAGQLNKFIKKDDPNVTALKISGDLNAKDLSILFSLPNIAYIDLAEAKNITEKYIYKDDKGKHELVIKTNEFPLLCGNSLKYIIAPKGYFVLSVLPETNYALDWLVMGDSFVKIANNNGGIYTSAKVTVENIRINSLHDNRYLSNIAHWVSLNMDIEKSSRFNTCSTLYITGNGNCLPENAAYGIRPQDIIIESTGEKILRYYQGNKTTIDLSDYDLIIPNAFLGTKIEEVNLGNKITEIPYGCFMNCNSLKRVQMSAVTKIGNSAFQGANIEEVDLGNKVTEIPYSCFKDCKNLIRVQMPAVTMIGKNAFAGTNIINQIQYTYKLPAEITTLDLNIFEGTGVKKIDLTEHSYAPDLIVAKENLFEDIQNNVEFLIPLGARSHRYNVSEWKKLRVVEYGAQDTYICQLDSVGSLKNFITDDNALNIRSLTLKGVMDETEFALIKKCKYLKYLNMKNCFTFASVEVQKGKAVGELFFLQLLSLGSTMEKEKAKQQYAHHETTYNKVQQTQIFDNYIKSLGIDDITMDDLDAVFGHGKVIPSKECYFPEGSFEGLRELEEVHFPNKLLHLERKHLYLLSGATAKYKDYIKHLKKVRLSNELHTLGDYLFANSPLEDINIPDSLKIVGFSCFKNCKLQKVDLTKTNITTFHLYQTNRYQDWEAYMGETTSIGLPLFAFAGNPLQEIKMPQKIDKVEWIGDKLSDDPATEANEVVVYVYFKEPFCKANQFERMYGKIKEIHIPRGMKAAWRGYPNLIDDIDL